MDGNAISLGFASSPGPDWLKDVVPTLGLRLKVYNDLRSLVADESQNGVSNVNALVHYHLIIYFTGV